jgi:hypothetical protein
MNGERTTGRSSDGLPGARRRAAHAGVTPWFERALEPVERRETRAPPRFTLDPPNTRLQGTLAETGRYFFAALCPLALRAT